MARHRSPQGRRAHLGLPLSPSPAAAGAGGAYRIPASPQLTSSPQLMSSLPVRFVATAIAGSALAAAGQLALTSALPAAVEGANVLRIGVGELLAPGAAAAATPASPAAEPVAAPTPALTPVSPELPVIGGADLATAELAKAADLDRLAAEQAARAAEQTRIAEEAAAAEAARAVEAAATTSVAGGVQMLVGRITSGFGARWGTSHQGLDIAAPIGTPIRVPLDGTVIDSGPASGFGQWVRVEHSDGTITVYGHISRSLVSVGERVSAGEMIAEVGNEGRSTGPHLHFEVVTPGGTKINPRPWLDERGIGLT
ncbi:M23 family metallopeptidase [Pseudonocardia sp.]|uniref:M23 family metallopeptidase n=1 Tax=Pseudonocardia sp. TaxID=60912 RepID=UPI00260B178D|nr:M23 family metallopeptidase [Pseudonocardia sp.]